MKSCILIQIMLASALLALFFGVVVAENPNMTMPVGTTPQNLAKSKDMAVPVNKNTSDNMTMTGNMTKPMNMTMPMKMPMNMTMPMTDSSVNIFIQNVSLNIVTVQNVTYTNSIPPSNMSKA
jgi:hypothetical protein